MMLTFTVDPKLFATPGLALQYVTERRCIAETMRILRRERYIGPHWLAVVEWQARTGMPHWHVLVDAEFVPWDRLLAAWSLHRPASAGLVEGSRPEFGTVQYAKSDGTAMRAIFYVTKYLTKFPDGGYPQWVMESERRIRRFSTSRNFWGGGSADVEDEKLADSLERQVSTLTPQQRVDGCGTRLIVYRVTDECDTESGDVESRYRFECVTERPSGLVSDELMEGGWVFQNRIPRPMLHALLREVPRRLTG